MSVAGIVLAAGGSRRLGEPKQLLRDHHGEALVHKVAREALEVGLHPVVVVLGAFAKHVREAVVDLDVVIEENGQWEVGISSSILAGVAVVAASKSEGGLLLTCDMPSVGVAHLRAVLDASKLGRQRVASTYGNTIGIPAVIPAPEFPDLQLLEGDKGAKLILSREGTVHVALEGGAFDLDTQSDVAMWRAAQQP